MDEKQEVHGGREVKKKKDPRLMPPLTNNWVWGNTGPCIDSRLFAMLADQNEKPN